LAFALNKFKGKKPEHLEVHVKSETVPDENKLDSKLVDDLKSMKKTKTSKGIAKTMVNLLKSN
jgi:hypothetical protein